MSCPTAKHAKHNKLRVANIREIGVYFSCRNNLVNISSFAKVFVPVITSIPRCNCVAVWDCLIITYLQLKITSSFWYLENILPCMLQCNNTDFKSYRHLDVLQARSTFKRKSTSIIVALYIPLVQFSSFCYPPPQH